MQNLLAFELPKQINFQTLLQVFGTYCFQEKNVDEDLVLFILKDPQFSRDPIASHLVFMWAKWLGLDFSMKDFDLSLLSLSELCHFAIIRKMAGFTSDDLANCLMPLLQFPTLLTSEHKFDPQRDQIYRDLLAKSFGFDRALYLANDPYLKLLDQYAPKFSFQEVVNNPFAEKINFSTISIALAKQGSQVPMGSAIANDIVINAFGPQDKISTDASSFGVSFPHQDAQSCYVSANAEIWMQCKADVSISTLNFRFYGLKLESPLFLSFFVSAKKVVIHDDVYQTRSLQTFKGVCNKVQFINTGKLQIQTVDALKTQLIPLSGEKSFWGSDFMLCFEIPFHAESLSFSFNYDQ